MTTFALVLETNNLTGGGADTVRTVASLERLFLRLREQSRPLTSLADLVVTHDGLPAGARAKLDRVAGVAVRWVQLAAGPAGRSDAAEGRGPTGSAGGAEGSAPRGIDYYEAKNVGFDATDADVVAFADADCWPEPRWLEELLAPFGDGEVQVVAGRTTYRTDVLGTAASTIDFMYFPSPLGQGCTRNFYANNVAFRREVFGAFRYASHDMYRGHCQILGTRLHRAAIKIQFVPAARTIHRFPDRLAELVKLRLLRGEDTIEMTPHLVKTYLPAASRLGNLGPVVPLAVLAARFVFSVRSVNRQDMPPAHGVRWLATVGAIAGLSLIDAAGTVARGLGGWRPAAGRDTAAGITLSYHEDRDHITHAPPVAAARIAAA